MRVDWVLMDSAAQAQVAVGDLVSVEAGGTPIYRVLRVTEGRAWVRDDQREMVWDLLDQLRFHTVVELELRR